MNNPSLLLEKTRLIMLCSNIYPYKTYPHISPVKHPILYSPTVCMRPIDPANHSPSRPESMSQGIPLTYETDITYTKW